MRLIRNSTTYVVLVLILTIGSVGCKSKKKAMEASNAEKARMEQEAALKKQREQEEASRKEFEERERREAEARNSEIKVSAPATRLNEYFQAIANSSNATSANSSINEALSMFSSPDAPVLIVISEYNGQKDYDRPTTIGKYLNYLKDQKKNINAITDFKTDASGKITELELRKN